jgi:hypothetical protein
MDQMRELGQFIAQAASRRSPALVVGDFNVEPGTPHYDALVSGGRLQRLMTLDSRVDHIFAVENPRYRFEVLSTEVIEETVSIEGEPVELTDHPAYVSTVRITPVEPAPEDTPLEPESAAQPDEPDAPEREPDAAEAEPEAVDPAETAPAADRDTQATPNEAEQAAEPEPEPAAESQPEDER